MQEQNLKNIKSKKLYYALLGTGINMGTLFLKCCNKFS